jgi:hypothetical protein
VEEALVSRHGRLMGRAMMAALFASGLLACDNTTTSSVRPTVTPTQSGSAAPDTQRPACLDPGEGRIVVRPTSNGQQTRILLLGTGTRGVVLAPQTNGGICQWLFLARHLAARGYRTAAMDYWSDRYDEDMANAVTVVRTAGASRVALVGASRGAIVALGSAHTYRPRIVGVVSVGAAPSEVDGYPTVTSLVTYRGPLLLMSSREESFAPASVTRRIAAAHPGGEQVVIWSGTDHGVSLFMGPHEQQVTATVDRFLARVLR